MTQVLQVQCIHKTNRFSAYERISYVGGRHPYVWGMSQTEAIRAIESGAARMFVHANGVSVWVVVATSALGNKYLKTQNDGEQPNNLLSLPECP